MKNKPEILAPAGSFECVLSAVRTGADAVYLGTKNFNARKGAENFSCDELKKTRTIGAWLSLVERCVRDAEVAGSNPVAPIKTPQVFRLVGFVF